MARMRRIPKPKPAADSGKAPDDKDLYPERLVVLKDGSQVLVDPWSFLQGREMMDQVLSAWVSKYNLMDPDKPAFQLFEMGEGDLIRMVQLHFGWADKTLAKWLYEDILALAEGIWLVNCIPVLGKSFRLVSALGVLVPKRTLENDSPSQSNSSSRRATTPTELPDTV